MITHIVAIGRNKEIGKDNKLLWHIPDDLKRFKQLTMGKTVFVGRKTFEDLPELKGRHVVPVSRSKIGELLLRKNINDGLDVIIIGGSKLYDAYKPDRILLTEVDKNYPDADAFYNVDLSNYFAINTELHDGFSFIEYVLDTSKL